MVRAMTTHKARAIINKTDTMTIVRSQDINKTSITTTSTMIKVVLKLATIMGRLPYMS